MPVEFAEMVEILALLSRDPDPEIQAEARHTFAYLPSQPLADLLEKPETSAEILEFAVHALGVNQAPAAAVLKANPALRPDLRTQLEAIGAPAPPEVYLTPPLQPPEGENAGPEAPDEGMETTLQRVARLTAPEKIKCALTGSQEERMLLIRDANKSVARSVLQSPKISEAEIEAFAAMASLSEEVLRLIAGNRGFMKSYAVGRALINNPHAPLDVTLPLVTRLHDRDLKMLSLNRNVADALRTAAVKLVRARTESRGPSYQRR